MISAGFYLFNLIGDVGDFIVRTRRRMMTCCCALVTLSVASQPVYATTVRMEITSGGINIGNIDIQLFDEEAPVTVANFLRYAGRGDYNGSVFHRSLTPTGPLQPLDVIQAGSYQRFDLGGGGFFYASVTTDAPVVNEFSSLRPNERGTVAMARLGSTNINDRQANEAALQTATSGWFINVINNPVLDDLVTPNYFAVFGRVLDPGMDIVDTVGSVQTYPPAGECPRQFPPPSCAIRFFDGTASSDALFFSDFPLVNYTYTTSVSPPVEPAIPDKDNLILVSRIPNVRSVVLPGTRAVLATYAADPDMSFSSATSLGSNESQALVKSFPRTASTVVSFNLGILSATVDGLGATAARMITMWDSLVTRPTHYYAYGRTPDNTTPHWYDFSFDPVTNTGAVITPNNIELYFVDGLRGDDDLNQNGSITHAGAPVTITATTTTSNSSSCSLSQAPVGISRAGDWGVVALFFVFVAGLRARRAAITGQKR